MAKEYTTDCSKCGAKMPDPPKFKDRFANLPFTITGYTCKECGHRNDLKLRKGYKENQAAK